MRNTKKTDSSSVISGRSSQTSDKKDFNDEEVAKKIDELRKKARQDMMDYEALDGVSLTHYLRIRQASRLLSTDENMNEDNTEQAAFAVEKVKEEEMKKMARTVLKKWQNFTKGDMEPREVRPKRRKSVRFKDEVEAKENDAGNNTPALESNQSKDNPKDVQIVFPAIIQPRPTTRQKRKKNKEHFMGTLLPPIPQNEEKSKDSSGHFTKNDFEVLIQDRLPKLKLKPVSLTTRTPPPSEEDETDSDGNPANDFVINTIHDDITFDSSQELSSQTNRSSSSVGRQPTPFPGEPGNAEVPASLTREPTLFWKLKKKFSESPKTKTGRRKRKEEREKKVLLKRIENYAVSEETELGTEQESEK